MTIQEEGNSNTGMWGHYCETSSVYKRTPSRDYSSMTDVEENSDHLGNNFDNETSNPSWKLSLSHVLVATISSFLFGYHLGVVNEPLGSIYLDLGFSENTLAEGDCDDSKPELHLMSYYTKYYKFITIITSLVLNGGLVVSICLGGALIGCLLSGWIADGVGRCRAFQLCALPMIIGSSTSQVGVTDTVGAAENILEAEETNSVMAHSHVAANPRATLLRRSSRIMRLNLMMNDYVRGK